MRSSLGLPRPSSMGRTRISSVAASERATGWRPVALVTEGRSTRGGRSRATDLFLFCFLLLFVALFNPLTGVGCLHGRTWLISFDRFLLGLVSLSSCPIGGFPMGRIDVEGRGFELPKGWVDENYFVVLISSLYSFLLSVYNYSSITISGCLFFCLILT